MSVPLPASPSVVPPAAVVPPVTAGRFWVRVGRLIPDGIAARIAMTVALALILTQAISVLVFVSFRGEPRPAHPLQVVVERVAAIVQLVESTPPDGREKVVRAVNDPLLGVEYLHELPSSLAENSPPRAFPGALERLRNRLRAELGDPNRKIGFELRQTPAWPQLGPLAPPPPHRHMFMPGQVRLIVPLINGGWLAFVTNDPDGDFRWLRFGLWMGLIICLVGGLSLWAARRLTAPLEGFARAAERLGVDGETPPLPETGPSELRAATRAVNRMQERLSRFVDDRTRMLAAIGHDLRTPLTRLRLRAEFVEDPELQRKMLSDLDEMEAMLRETLAFARNDAKREARVPIDLADLLQSLCEDRADSGHDAGYQGAPHFTLTCRPVALRRALANLIDNAIHYGGVARVALTTDDNGHALITIDDDGPGIPEAERERVFQPFYRLESSRSRDTGGTGLGLSVARTIVRGHGGDVILHNRNDRGLSAIVSLPI
ncbi:two-component system, OmpR family, osmolarity sensor histidine kinase EnvZ [uncultured Gammaproteobacteria bacterium]